MRKGETKFHAGGVEYSFRLGLGALDEYEERYGENSILVLSKLEDPESDPTRYIAPLVNLFELGLTPRPESRQATREILDELGTDAFLKIISDASTSAFLGSQDPDAEGKKPGNGKKRS